MISFCLYFQFQLSWRCVQHFKGHFQSLGSAHCSPKGPSLLSPFRKSRLIIWGLEKCREGTCRGAVTLATLPLGSPWGTGTRGSSESPPITSHIKSLFAQTNVHERVLIWGGGPGTYCCEVTWKTPQFLIPINIAFDHLPITILFVKPPSDTLLCYKLHPPENYF